VARIGEGRSVYRVLGGRPESKNHWEGLVIYGKITFIWTLESYGSMGRTGFVWLRIGSNGGLL
jgi:hypothetical protein